MLTGAANHAKEQVKHYQRDTAGQPATEKLADNDLTTSDGFGQQREDSTIFAFGVNLASSRGDGDHQRRNPNEKQTDFFDIADDFRIVEDADRTGHECYQRGED